MVWTHSSWKLNIKGFFQFHFYSSSNFFIHAYDIPKEILSMDVWVGTLASFLVILTTEANYNVTLFFHFGCLLLPILWILVAKREWCQQRSCTYFLDNVMDLSQPKIKDNVCFQEILISNRVFYWLRCHRLRTNDHIISRHIQKRRSFQKQWSKFYKDSPANIGLCHGDLFFAFHNLDFLKMCVS